MTTPDTAKELLDGFVESWEGPDEEMYQVAPDMAETIAGMTEEWACEWDSSVGGLYVAWHGDRKNVERDVDDMRFSGANARLVRRLVSVPEVIDGE